MNSPSELMCDITQVVCAKTRTTASDGLFGGYPARDMRLQSRSRMDTLPCYSKA